MRFMLISDNHDTATGLRLAGIDGVIVHSKEEVANALNKVLQSDDIGIVLITEKLVPLCPDIINDIKLNRKVPLIVEIPDRHVEGRRKDSIIRYVREAIGVKI
ncbi:MAG TPA: ATP synthase subunit F [Clostridiales bacterium]|nr:ATP synthase subunit F [Clostridiales bacterium]